MPALPEHALIQSQADLAAWLSAFSSSPVLALDTEFLRERSYRPQLCLIQLGDAAHQVCVDPQADLDLSPLGDFLAQPTQPKLIHAAGQDIEVLHQSLGILPASLFDTQIAAALCGLGEQMGYAALVEHLLGVVLDKSHSRTDWAQRPLSAQQYRYALDDVRYLPAAHALLDEQLTRLGRLEWMREDCAAQLDPARWTIAPFEAWRRLKGWQRLPVQVFPRLRQLAAWRELRARALDLPRRWVLDDDTLLRLVSRPPRTLEALRHGKMLPAQLFTEAEAIMLALQHADDDDTPAPPAWTPMSDAARGCLARLVNALEQCAQALNLPASLLLNRSELERLARDPAALGLVQGWRGVVLGEALAAVM
jgi:ribonuclease D